MTVTPSSSPARRRCIFCGAAGPLTREHIYPQWLRELPGPRELHGSRLVEQPILRNKTISPDRFGFPVTLTFEVGKVNPKASDLQIKMLCESCNSGWLGSLEGSVKPLVLQLLDDSDTELTVQQWALIAAWAAWSVAISTKPKPLELLV